MIRKSGNRFSEMVMLNQETERDGEVVAPAHCLGMILLENRYTLFRIMP
jgi:hypothetical protein